MNRLGQETSPYLLQHKDNPVHWWAWGPEALAEAKRTGKPILLSVGYAACHWCHVMAHESFEDVGTADVMNGLYVNIKVDREERPDIDAIYMNALHALGEQGGWPLTMFLDSEARPFFGGTYFPKQAQFGRPAFVTVLLQIAQIYQNEPDRVRPQVHIFTADKGSRAARSYFKEEAKKTFLGEPYERVMANFYRGILYWMDGEPDNARACFRNGQFQDADAESQEYAADWVLLDYLDGLVTARLGSDGSDAFKRAKAHARLAIPPEPKPRANLLFFLEYGKGPTKYAAGQYGEQLRFKEGTSTTREVMVRVGGQAVHVGPYDDLNFQATTRGGRVMDHVLGNKAVFKATTDTFGDAAIIGGAITAMAGSGQGNSMDEVGAGLVIAGVLSKLVSAPSTPRADTRGWDNLPLYLSFAAFEVPPGTHAATIEFLDAKRQPLANLTRTVSISIPTPETTRVVFVSDRSTLPQSL